MSEHSNIKQKVERRVKKVATTKQLRPMSIEQLLAIREGFLCIGKEGKKRGEEGWVDAWTEAFWKFETEILHPDWKDTLIDSPHKEWIRMTFANRESAIYAYRGSAKTTICTIDLSLWLHLRNNNDAIGMCGYTQNQSRRWIAVIAMYTRTNQRLRFFFPEVIRARITVDTITLPGRSVARQEDGIMALSVKSAQTGLHPNWLFLDDLIDLNNTRTEHQREYILLWYRMTLLPMLTDVKSIGHRGTRYRINDFAREILGYSSAEIKAGQEPLIPTNVKTWDCFDEHGEPIWKSRHGKAFFEKERKSLGSAAFAAQFQQNPSLLLGLRCRYEWIQLYTKDVDYERTVLSLDPAISPQGDYAAISVMSTCEGNYYLRHAEQGHWTMNEQVLRIQRLWDKYSPDNVLIESVAFQEALAQEIRRRVKIPVKSIKKDKNKEACWSIIEPYFENLQVFIKAGLGFVVDQLLEFPEGKHDDLVDTITQVLEYYTRRPEVKPIPFISFGKRFDKLIKKT